MRHGALRYAGCRALALLAPLLLAPAPALADEVEVRGVEVERQETQTPSSGSEADARECPTCRVEASEAERPRGRAAHPRDERTRVPDPEDLEAVGEDRPPGAER